MRVMMHLTQSRSQDWWFKTQLFNYTFRILTTRKPVYLISPPVPTAPAGSSSFKGWTIVEGCVGWPSLGHTGRHTVSSRRSPSLQQESSCDRLLSPGTNLHPAPSPWRPSGNSPVAAPTRRPHTRQLPLPLPRPSSAPPGTPPGIPLPSGSRATLRARRAPARSGRAAPPRPVSHPARERVASGGAARDRG